MFKRVLPLAALAVVLAPLQAQEKLNADINARIRQEEAAHSQIMRTLHFLTDVYGPRVTGSPNHKAAAEWNGTDPIRDAKPLMMATLGGSAG